jgi:uncharacterized protein involved in exopolysaccharide biosynthesis
MADSEFTPLYSLTRILSRWWIIVAMAVSGGILGWVFHFFHPPVYEATTVLTITMDFTERELTQYEQDYAFNAVGAIITSTVVKEQIVSSSQINGVSISQTQLAKQIFLEGRQSVWELHVRDQDPYNAAEIANIWAQVANDVLNAALEHAMQADQLQVQMKLMEACLPFTPGVAGYPKLPPPVSKDCGRFSLMEIEMAMQNWTKELVQEKQQTLGILPIFEFAITGYASIPEKPVLSDLSSLTLAGALIGFVVSLWVAGSSRVRRRV